MDEIETISRRPLWLGALTRWQFWLGVAVSTLALWYALRGLELDRVWQEIRTANYWWLVPSVGAYLLALVARTWRWEYLLRPLARVPWPRLFPVVMIGYFGNNILPFRAGELLRAYVLKRREGIGLGPSLATVIVERVFDGLVMLMFVFVGLPLAPIPSQELRQLVIVASLAFFVALLLFFALAAMPRRSLRLVERLASTLLPSRLQPTVIDFARRFLLGLVSLRSFRSVLILFFTSTLVWLLETAKYWFIMHAFPFEVSFFALMLMNGVVNLTTTLPSAPGYVGTFDASGIEVLVRYSVGRGVATAYTLVLHAALWVSATAPGAYYMLQEGIGWAELSEAVQATEGEAPS